VVTLGPLAKLGGWAAGHDRDPVGAEQRGDEAAAQPALTHLLRTLRRLGRAFYQR